MREKGRAVSFIAARLMKNNLTQGEGENFLFPQNLSPAPRFVICLNYGHFILERTISRHNFADTYKQEGAGGAHVASHKREPQYYLRMLRPLGKGLTDNRFYFLR